MFEGLSAAAPAIGAAARCVIELGPQPSSPRACFLLHNVRPDLLCYLVAEREGYYDEAASSTLLDPRSVDGYSPLIYADCGFKLDKTGAMLYRLIGL